MKYLFLYFFYNFYISVSKIINSLFLVIFIIKNLINIFYLKNNILKQIIKKKSH
jgi:hypothetical protein